MSEKVFVVIDNQRCVLVRVTDDLYFIEDIEVARALGEVWARSLTWWKTKGVIVREEEI